jgi:hypothetical protein
MEAFNYLSFTTFQKGKFKYTIQAVHYMVLRVKNHTMLAVPAAYLSLLNIIFRKELAGNLTSSSVSSSVQKLVNPGENHFLIKPIYIYIYIQKKKKTLEKLMQ